MDQLRQDHGPLPWVKQAQEAGGHDDVERPVPRIKRVVRARMSMAALWSTPM